MARKSVGKSKGKGAESKSTKSRVQAIVMQFESQVAEATAAAAAASEPPKKTLLKKPDANNVKDNSTSQQVNLSAAPYGCNASLNSRSISHRVSLDSPTASLRSSPRSSWNRAAVRELMKNVKQHYNRPPSEKSKAWVKKVLAEVFKVPRAVAEKGAAVAQSDHAGSGDDDQNEADQSSVTPPETAVSGDVSTEDKEDKEPAEEGDIEEQYQLYCNQMRTILSKASGLPVSDIGLSLAEYRQLLKQMGCSNVHQLLAETSQRQLVYKPEIIVLDSHEQLQVERSQVGGPEPGPAANSTLTEQVQSVQVVTSEMYFFPNKLTFQ